MAKGSDNPFPSILLVEQASAPATPSSGRARLYRGTDNKLNVVDDAGVVTEVGGSGASAAVDVTYDNTTSGLTAADVQAAIDEVAAASGSNAVEATGTITKLHGPITQATYDGLTPAADTLYVIVG